MIPIDLHYVFALLYNKNKVFKIKFLTKKKLVCY